MSAAFTPGPWWYQEDSDAYTHIVRAGQRRFITQLGQDTSGVAEANARLIAAAPELYEALVDLVRSWDCPNTEFYSQIPRIYAAASAAIAKARGEA